MLMFALFFCVYAYYRAEAVDLYNSSQEILNAHYGFANTLLLLTSSWFVVIGVESARHGRTGAVPGLFLIAWLCGAGFAVLKVIEYSEKIGQDIVLNSNEFFMFYYVLTGLHFLHVLIGLAVLAYLILRARRRQCAQADITAYESGASFWHMVDLLWIVLFPLIYLLR